MKLNAPTIIGILAVILSFALVAYFYPQMPEEIPTHWNAQGEVDSYSSKDFGMFLFPIIALFVFALMKGIPYIDPLKKNIDKFMDYYEWAIVLIILFFLAIQSVTILWTLGNEIPMNYVVIPAMGILFFGLGIMMEKSKRNWFIGFRTPWTLSSDKVWDKTNKLAGKWFKIFGVFAIIATFFLETIENIWIIVGPMLAIVAGLFVYSYLEYKKEKK